MIAPATCSRANGKSLLGLRVKYASARKIPQLRMLFFLALALPPSAWCQTPDSARTFRAARAAEAEYERAARRLAPLGSGDGKSGCDEYVGRFCLYYDAGRDTLPAEPIEIRRYRERAVTRLTAALDLNPARTTTVFPLIRLLLQHERPRDALAVAERFRGASRDTATASMLLALTYHASGEIEAAEHAIDQWLLVVDSAERRRLTDLRWLLESREERLYRTLTGDSLSQYERRFWRYADALYLSRGNETRTEHFSRNAESRLVEIAPTVFGGTSWGKDVAELTIRYGTPKARTRLWSARMGSEDLSVIEHWDPEQLMYAPPALDSVLRVRARPGMGWPLDTVRSVSGHAPSTIRRMLPLEHQANIFRAADGRLVLRVDGAVPRDSMRGNPAHYDAGLFLLDKDLAEVGHITRAAVNDSLGMSLELPLPADALFYSAEILERDTRLSARARFRIDPRVDEGGLFLSDLLIADPFPPTQLPGSRSEVKPRPTLVMAPGAFGLFAEVSLGRPGPDTARVELEIVSIDGSPAMIRAARWLGQRLGLADRPPPRRLTWSTEVRDSLPAALAVTLDPGNLKPGRYIVEMAVSNGGRRVVARREILFSASATSSRRP
jgi:hypothetical protein